MAKSSKSFMPPTVDDRFKKGLDWQRERFKSGKSGEGENNFDVMCDAIENLKSEIKNKVIKVGKSREILRVERIIRWYQTLESKCTRQTEHGPKVIFPKDLGYLVNHNLTVAYELLIIELENLGLL